MSMKIQVKGWTLDAPVEMPTFHARVPWFEFWLCFWLQLTAIHALGGSKYLELFHLHERPRLDSGLLTLALSKWSYFKHLG